MEVKNIKIGKWSLQYEKGKYWLYNPKGLGGSLHFYFDSIDEYNESNIKNHQLLGFEGSYLPDYVYKALLKYQVNNIKERENIDKNTIGYITLNNWGGIAVLEVESDYIKWCYRYGGDTSPVEIYTSEIEWLDIDGEAVPIWYTDDNKTDYYRLDEVMKVR